MENRLKNAAEGLIFGLIFACLFWFLGFIIKRITGKEIRTSAGYVVVIILGFLSQRILLVLLAG